MSTFFFLKQKKNELPSDLTPDRPAVRSNVRVLSPTGEIAHERSRIERSEIGVARARIERKRNRAIKARIGFADRATQTKKKILK